jgi:hypothetical protein
MDIADFSLSVFSPGRARRSCHWQHRPGRAFSLALAKVGADAFAVGLARDNGTTRRLIQKNATFALLGESLWTGPVPVTEAAPAAEEIPKSMIRGPSGASSTLDGLRSRWMTPAA